MMKIKSNFTEEEILNWFISFYDGDYWINKIRTLQILIENEAIFNKITEDAILKKLDKESTKRTYKYDLHMASYHSSEALFGLIFAFIFQQKTPWIYLTEYKFSNFNNLVDGIKDNGLKSIMKEEDIPRFLQWLFFPTVTNETYPEFEKVEKSIQFIESYLLELARYLNDKKDYNAYKHGFRGLPLKSTISISDPKLKPILDSSEESCVYLDFDIENKDVKALKLVAKNYSYKTSMNIIAANTELIRNIINTRRQIMIDKNNQINFSLFHDKEIKSIFYPELKDKPAHVLKFQLK